VPSESDNSQVIRIDRVERLEGQRLDDEEVGGPDRLSMVGKEGDASSGWAVANGGAGGIFASHSLDEKASRSAGDGKTKRPRVGVDLAGPLNNMLCNAR
jgi:hypothetical protein